MKHLGDAAAILPLLDLSHLKVYVPEPDYLLSMKALAARVDSTDKQDVIFLIEKLGLKTPQGGLLTKVPCVKV